MSDETDRPTVLFVSGDLFLGSRVRGAVESRGWSLDVAGSGALAIQSLQSGAGYRLALIDLETPGLRIDDLMAAADVRPPCVAYGPHVHEARLDAARQAGCDQVLTRGQFDATLPQLLEQLDVDDS